MSPSTKLFFLTALLAAVCSHDANAEKKTVCSITVNSADEKEAFRRSLPPNKYEFVELGKEESYCGNAADGQQNEIESDGL